MSVETARRTLADLLEQLGGIAPDRIRMHPPPGTATEQDVLEIEARENRLCELVDCVLVEKPMGYVESILAGAILTCLRNFVVPKNLGHVSGADGMLRLFPGLVRIPDVAFASWHRFPEGRLPENPIPDLAPDLAVEVLNAGNTPAEMDRKRREYFDAGVKLVWMVDPRSRCVTAFTSPDERRDFSESDTLDAGEVLPGFSLALRELFSELDRVAGGHE
jgi:Uma2 family endonuclease